MAICERLKKMKIVAVWNFNMGVNGNITKCAICWKRLIVERNGRKCGTRGTTVHICRVLLMLDSLSLVWGHPMHFAKFQCYYFQNSTPLPIFIGFQSKFIVSTGMLVMREYKLWLFWRSAKKKINKNCMALWIFC